MRILTKFLLSNFLATKQVRPSVSLFKTQAIAIGELSPAGEVVKIYKVIKEFSNS